MWDSIVLPHCFLQSFIPLGSNPATYPQLLRHSTDLSITAPSTSPQHASSAHSPAELHLQIQLYPLGVIPRVYKTFLFWSPFKPLLDMTSIPTVIQVRLNHLPLNGTHNLYATILENPVTLFCN